MSIGTCTLNVKKSVHEETFFPEKGEGENKRDLVNLPQFTVLVEINEFCIMSDGMFLIRT